MSSKSLCAASLRFFSWRHNPKEARKPLNGCCAGLPGKAVADAPHAAGIDVAVFPNAKTHLVLDPWKDQVVGCCVVAAALAGFHRFMVEVLGQRDQAAGVGVPELGSVVDKGKDVVEVSHEGGLLKKGCRAFRHVHISL